MHFYCRTNSENSQDKLVWVAEEALALDLVCEEQIDVSSDNTFIGCVCLGKAGPKNSGLERYGETTFGKPSLESLVRDTYRGVMLGEIRVITLQALTKPVWDKGVFVCKYSTQIGSGVTGGGSTAMQLV